MAIDYTAEIEALKLAIASGATHVSFDGKTVDYGTREDLMARLRWLQDQLVGGPSRPACGFASFSRGE